MKYRKIFALLLAAATLFSLAACGETAAGPEATPDPALDESAATVSGQTLTFAGAADDVFSLSLDYEESLNPVKTQSTLNQLVDCLVYDRLFEVDENFNVTSRILSDWYYSKNEDSAGVWVLKVREGIQMHDGSTLTAQDVAYSVSCIFTSERHKPLQQQVGRVYSSAYNGEVYLAVEGADNAQLPQRMSIPIIKSGSVGDEIPVGSGPYMYNEDRTALVKFDGYENSESLPLDEVQLRAYRGMEELITEFESGLVDLVVNDPTGIYNMGYGGKNEKRTITTTNLHFIGFNSYYAIPFGNKTAHGGEWHEGPKYDLFEVIKRETGKDGIIAEDLGIITPSVRKLLKQAAYPGMKVLQFAFDPTGKSEYLPQNYTSQNCVVYTSTHDNDTALGWFNDLDRKTKRFVKEYLGVRRAAELPKAFIDIAWKSTADMAMTTMQELCGFGTEARINVPSTVGNNWRWRTLDSDFTAESAEYLNRLTEICNRKPTVKRSRKK